MKNESVAEKIKTEEALLVLNSEIHAVLRTAMEKRSIDPKTLRSGDVEMAEVEGEFAKDVYLKGELILKIRAERKTDGEVRFHLIH